MARGLLTGALFLHICAFVCCVLMNLDPFAWSAWLVQKSEISDDFCIQGEGVWETNLVLSSLSSDRCKERLNGVHHQDAATYYCGEDSPLPEMCSWVYGGRFLLVIGFLVELLAFAPMVWANLSHTESLQLKLFPVTVSLLFSVLSVIVHTTLLSVMGASPLFTDKHFHDLGKDLDVNYRGMGCVFQSPFVGGLSSLFGEHHPMECVYPGPALVCAFGATIFSFFAAIMGFLLRRKILTSDATSLENVAAYAWARLSPSRTSFVHQQNTESIHYSLLGAVTRRFSSLPHWQRRYIGVMVPCLTVGNAMLLVAWFYHGLQFKVRVLVHDVSTLEDLDESIPLDSPDRLEINLISIVLQVFTFDPVTSLRTFWEAKGYLMCIATAFWINFFPFVKIIMWLWMWFVPMDEKNRGRLLTWFDYLGKYTLITLFTLSITSLAFLFSSRIAIPLPLPGLHRAVAVDISVEYQPGRGVEWFIGSILWTILLGSGFVDLHSRAKDWENKRRGDAYASSRHLQVVPDQRFTDSLDSEDFTFSQHDTPYHSIRGIVGEVTRRAQDSLIGALRESGARQSLSQQILLDKYYFTQSGRLVIWSAIAFTVVVTMVGLSMPVITFQRQGFTGTILVNSPDRNVSFSMGDFATQIAVIGGPTRPSGFSGIIFVFGLIMPAIHVFGLFLLWGMPFKTKEYAIFFRMMEFLDAWNALDVFIFAVFIVWFGVEGISLSVVGQVVPGMTEFIDKLFPGFRGVYPLRTNFEPGFYVLGVSVVARWTMSFVLTELAAVSLAQRQLQTQDLHFADGSTLTREPRLLNADELAMFSPASRYIGASFPSEQVWAGLPKVVWTNGEKFGLIRMCSTIEDS